MTDLGIYNFIKNELAQGQTKEQISAQLLKNNMSQANIDEAFASLVTGLPPLASSPLNSTPDLIPESRNHQNTWNYFRNSFWKYYIAVVALGVIGRISIPFLPFICDILILICVIALIRSIGSITKEIQGRASVLLMFVCFFCSPLAYYFVYRMSKKNEWDIKLNLFEYILIWIGGIIFLLGTILIVGIISALLLASVPHTPNHGLSVSQGARNTTFTNSDSELKNFDLPALEFDAARVDQVSGKDTYSPTLHRNVYSSSYSNLCLNGVIDINAFPASPQQDISKDVQKVLSDTNSASQTQAGITCVASNDKYAISARLSDGTFWCIDSDGKPKSGTASSITFSCQS